MNAILQGALTLAVAMVIRAGPDDQCPCANGGVCTGDQMCLCPEGYGGNFCLMTPCLSNPCNEGRCKINGAGYNCICDQYTVGPTCIRLMVPVLQEPELVVYSNTSKYKISCTATGTPDPSYFLIENGTMRSSDRLFDHEQDPGRYQCGARNDYGTALSDNIITKRVAFKNENTSMYRVNLGDHVEMDCAQPTTEISVTYTWFKFYSVVNRTIIIEVNSSAGFHVDFKGSLHIFQVMINETGIYKCNVTFVEKGRIYSTVKDSYVSIKNQTHGKIPPSNESVGPVSPSNETRRPGFLSNETHGLGSNGNSVQTQTPDMPSEVTDPEVNTGRTPVPVVATTSKKPEVTVDSNMAPTPLTLPTGPDRTSSDATTRHPPTPTTYMTPPKPVIKTTTTTTSGSTDSLVTTTISGSTDSLVTTTTSGSTDSLVTTTTSGRTDSLVRTTTRVQTKDTWETTTGVFRHNDTQDGAVIAEATPAENTTISSTGSSGNATFAENINDITTTTDKDAVSADNITTVVPTAMNTTPSGSTELSNMTTTRGQSTYFWETSTTFPRYNESLDNTTTTDPGFPVNITSADDTTMVATSSSGNATTLAESVNDITTTTAYESAAGTDNMTTVFPTGLTRRRRQAGVFAVRLTADRDSYMYGQTAVLECLCNHRSNQTTWNITYPKGTQLSLMNRRLTIINVSHQHEGNYTCTCAGQRSNPVHITVKAALTWTSKPKPQIRLEGKTVSLKCSVMSSDGNPHRHTEWFINTKPIQEYANSHNISYELTYEDTHLSFPNISRSVHNFNLQCNVSNNHTYLYYNSYLMVLVPMELSADEENYVIGPSESEELHIKVKRDPITTDDETIIKWKHRPSGQSEYHDLPGELNKHSIHLDVQARNTSWRDLLGGYKCVVTVREETKFVRFYVSERQESFNMNITIVGLTCALIGVIFISIICKKRRMIRKALRRKAADPDKVFLDLTNTNQSSRYVRFPRNTDEFPVDRLHFLDTLGSGNFGKVMKAEALDIHGSGKWEIVAVKMCKNTATDATKENLYHETVIMRKIPKHINVVGYLGYVTSSEPSLLIMEFVGGGDLLTYLRKRRPEKAKVKVTDEEKGEVNDEDSNGKETKENDAVTKEDTPTSDENEVGNLLSSRDLSSFALQISRGMEHLATLNVIHRDLAARNVLLGVGNVCKISDFGLARDMEGSDEYEVSSMGPLPIRWMSPESLTDGLYTLKSDVWSYGVLLWEIVTLGASPYSGQSARQVMQAVRNGKRLEKPDHCADSVYSLMTRCWRQHPGDRPTFSDLSTTIEGHLEEEAEYIQLSNFDVNIYDVIDMGAIDVIEERV